jgi:hypothetical protein
MRCAWRAEWDEPGRRFRSALMAGQDAWPPPAALTRRPLRPAPTRPWSHRDHSRSQFMLNLCVHIHILKEDELIPAFAIRLHGFVLIDGFCQAGNEECRGTRRGVTCSIHRHAPLPHLVIPISIIYDRPLQDTVYCMDITLTSQMWTAYLQIHHTRLASVSCHWPRSMAMW